MIYILGACCLLLLGRPALVTDLCHCNTGNTCTYILTRKRTEILNNGSESQVKLLLTGVAVDGSNKTSTDSNNSICLIKTRGKVKALDEELYSEFMHILLFLFLLIL